MKKLAFGCALILAAFALVACGGDDNGTTTTNDTTAPTETEGGQAGGGAAGKGSTVDLASPPDASLSYTSDSAEAQAGKVTIKYDNPQSIDHDVAIEDADGETVGKTELVAEGETSTVVDLEPGEYTFYCTVPGHREAGMEGTLTVK